MLLKTYGEVPVVNPRQGGHDMSLGEHLLGTQPCSSQSHSVRGGARATAALPALPTLYCPAALFSAFSTTRHVSILLQNTTVRGDLQHRQVLPGTTQCTHKQS
jgi:hypothetical protein